MNKLIAYMRRNAVFIIALVVVIGIFMLYLKAQNDLHSSTLFLYKAIFFPLSLILLIKAWLISFILLKKEGRASGHRKWPIVVILLLTFLFSPHLLPNWKKSSQFTDIANQQGFSVATFSAMTRSRNAQDIHSFIKQYQPQVLCLQEVSVEDMEVLSDLYPYQNRHGESGQIILSKFPQQVMQVDSEKLGSKNIDSRSELSRSIKNMLQSVELSILDDQLEERAVTVLNVHMPRQYRQDGLSAKAIEALQWQVNSTGPVIICGDFNMTPDHTIYHFLTKQLGFNDAQLSQTWEYGFTFPNGNRRLAYFGTWLRIDYLFSRGFLSGSTQVINVSDLSDHKAVLSKFLFSN